MDARLDDDRVEATRTLTRLAAAIAAARGGRRAPRLALSADAPPARRASEVGAAERAAAEAAVRALVAQLRDEGVPPQRMLVDVKSLAREATLGVLDSPSAGALVEDVVRWSVDAFYAR